MRSREGAKLEFRHLLNLFFPKSGGEVNWRQAPYRQAASSFFRDYSSCISNAELVDYMKTTWAIERRSNAAPVNEAAMSDFASEICSGEIKIQG